MKPGLESQTAILVCTARATRSRLFVMYHAASLIQRITGIIVRRMGEPLRSKLKPDEIRVLLSRFGFVLRRDDDLGSLGAAISPAVGEAARKIRHNRVAIADRTS